MANETGISLEACFEDIPDPRVEGRCEHLRMDVIIMALPELMPCINDL